MKYSFTDLAASLSKYINIFLAVKSKADFIKGDWELYVSTVPTALGFLVTWNESLHPTELKVQIDILLAPPLYSEFSHSFQQCNSIISSFCSIISNINTVKSFESCVCICNQM